MRWQGSWGRNWEMRNRWGLSWLHKCEKQGRISTVHISEISLRLTCSRWWESTHRKLHEIRNGVSRKFWWGARGEKELQSLGETSSEQRVLSRLELNQYRKELPYSSGYTHHPRKPIKYRCWHLPPVSRCKCCSMNLHLNKWFTDVRSRACGLNTMLCSTLTCLFHPSTSNLPPHPSQSHDASHALFGSREGKGQPDASLKTEWNSNSDLCLDDLNNNSHHINAHNVTRHYAKGFTPKISGEAYDNTLRGRAAALASFYFTGNLGFQR